MLVEYTQLLRNGEIKSRRLALRLRQRDVADACGISVPAVAQIESFRNTATDSGAVKKVAAFLGITPQTLVPEWLKEVSAIPIKTTLETNLDQEGFRKLAESAQGALASGSRIVESMAITNEEAQRLVKAYALLPIEHRKVMRLYAEGYTLGQIVKLTKWSKTRIYQIINYSITMFMKMLPETQEYHRDEIASLLCYGIYKDGPSRIRIPKILPKNLPNRIRTAVPRPGSVGNGQAGDMVRLSKAGPVVIRKNIKLSISTLHWSLREALAKALEDRTPRTIGAILDACEKAGFTTHMTDRRDLLRQLSNILTEIPWIRKERRGWEYYWYVREGKKVDTRLLRDTR